MDYDRQLVFDGVAVGLAAVYDAAAGQYVISTEATFALPADASIVYSGKLCVGFMSFASRCDAIDALNNFDEADAESFAFAHKMAANALICIQSPSHHWN